MMTEPKANEATGEEVRTLIEQARTKAQARVADVHAEEGTVKSEKGPQLLGLVQRLM